jgi:hypothetical protein
VRVELHSVPVVIARAVANDSGVVVANGTVPADLAAGTHTLVLVVANDAGADPGTGNGSVAIPATVIAATGSEISPWIFAALLLMAGGAGAYFMARRRTARTSADITTPENR